MIDIEKLENLPKKENIRERIRNLNGHYERRYDRCRNIKVYNEAIKVIKKYLGKSVDKAYSEFCKRVHESREIFFEELGEGTYPWQFSTYYLVNKIIKKRPKRKIYYRTNISFPYTITTFDYKEVMEDLMTGKILSVKEYQDDLKYLAPYCRYKKLPGNWVVKVISGSKIVVYNWREYKKVMSEQMQKRKRYYGKKSS